MFSTMFSKERRMRMSGFRNKTLNLLFQEDDFRQISSYLVTCCENMKREYLEKDKRLQNDENKIRNILLKEFLAVDSIQALYQMNDYRFEPETQENYHGKGTYVGRADIKVILKSDFAKNDAYYLVECKRIDGTKNLNQKYVMQGIHRFITKKYSSFYGMNFMLGFVVRKIDISVNTGKIESEQNNSSDSRMHGSFVCREVNSERGVYNCMYDLLDRQLELKHIFIDFSKIINSKPTRGEGK
jgi:hypothetical protein